MNKWAYRRGAFAAMTKFGNTSSGVPTVSPEGRRMAINQAFGFNASLGQTSGMDDPPILNATMHGGSPQHNFQTDSMGGIRQLSDDTTP